MPKVAKKVAKLARKQIGKLTDEALETVKKTSGDMAGTALEQLGITAGGSSGSGKGQKQAGPIDEKARIEQMNKLDQAMAQRQIKQIKAEMDKWRRVRAEQLRRRREETEQAKAQAVAQQEAGSDFPQTSSKPKRGSLFLRKRGKKAEMAGMKRSG